MGGLAVWINDSLRRRIAVLVAALLLLVGAGVALVSYFQVLRVTRELRADRLRQLGEQLAPMLARGPSDAMQRLARTAADSQVVRFVAAGGGRDSERIAVLLRAPGDQRSGVALLDSSGKLLFQHLPDSIKLGFGPPIRLGDLGSLDAAGLTPLRQLNDTILYYDVYVPIRRAGQRIGGEIRRSRLVLSTNARSAYDILLGTGTSITLGSPASGVWTDLSAVIPAPPGALHYDTVSRVAWQGKDLLVLGLPIPGTPWEVAVRTQYDVIEAPARAYLRRAALLAALFVGLGGIAAVLLGRRISRPIEEITEVTEAVAGGDLERRAYEAVPGEVGRLAHSFNSMVERLASSSRRLRDSEASHRAFVSHSSEGIWHLEFVPPISTTLSRELQVASWYRMSPLVECNAALARMHGLDVKPERNNIALAHLFPPDDPACRRLLTGFIEHGYRCSEAESLGSHNGDTAHIYVNDLIGIVEQGGLRRIWGTRRDVTVERLMDERLAQTQRLEAIGRLAGGVAHDFNNLLTAIFGYAEALKEDLPAESAAQQDAAEIDRLAQRASDLTRHLLAFSRGQVLRPAAMNLNEVVRSTETLLRRVIGEDIELKLQLTEPLPSIEADAGQLERVLMNLSLNARDAMPGGGTLELRTAVVDLDAEYTRVRPGLLPGSYVMLAVSDSGTGMTDSVRRHVFEPFFTTKPKGQGTGLGLSTAYGIVRQSGGDISLYTEVGKGTTFKIFLPVRGRAVSATPAGPRTPIAAEHGGHETVLLVEDEEPVREVVRRALSSAGYTVLVARDANEALKIADSQLAEIDLVLTDMILPGMSGRDLVTEFRRRRPGLRLIIMSGYTGETYPALESLPEGTGYLEKPFSLAGLKNKLREALDAPA